MEKVKKKLLQGKSNSVFMQPSILQLYKINFSVDLLGNCGKHTEIMQTLYLRHAQPRRRVRNELQCLVKAQAFVVRDHNSNHFHYFHNLLLSELFKEIKPDLDYELQNLSLQR